VVAEDVVDALMDLAGLAVGGQGDQVGVVVGQSGVGVVDPVEVVAVFGSWVAAVSPGCASDGLLDG
jgi:hypothetical protein